MRQHLAATTSVVLGTLSGLNIAWAFGSSFPCRNRSTLADTIAGTERVPGAVECGVVAGLLGAAATLVADVGPLRPEVRHVGVLVAAAVRGIRGVAGLTGRTDVLVPWEPSPRFVALDRRCYGPLCLALALGTVRSLGPRPTLVPRR